MARPLLRKTGAGDRPAAHRRDTAGRAVSWPNGGIVALLVVGVLVEIAWFSLLGLLFWNVVG